MLEVGILKNFDSGTYKAGVQLAGSLTTYFDDISVAKNIPSSAMVVGNYVIVAIPGGNPRDACVIATWPQGTPGGGMEVHGNEYHDPDFATEAALFSVADKTYYIDAVAGDDSNGGEASDDAWETWNKAKSMIPIFVTHTYTIRIIGDLAVDLVLAGRIVGGALIIRGHTATAADHEINHFDLRQLIGDIRLNYLHTTDAVRNTVRDCMMSPSVSAGVRYMEIHGTADYGLQALGSILYVRDNDFGTDKHDSCLSSINSQVVSRTNSGNGKDYGLIASQGGIIAKVGAQPTGTVANEFAATGGVIR